MSHDIGVLNPVITATLSNPKKDFTLTPIVILDPDLDSRGDNIGLWIGVSVGVLAVAGIVGSIGAYGWKKNWFGSKTKCSTSSESQKSNSEKPLTESPLKALKSDPSNTEMIPLANSAAGCGSVSPTQTTQEFVKDIEIVLQDKTAQSSTIPAGNVNVGKNNP